MLAQPRVSFPQSEVLGLCSEYGSWLKIDPSQVAELQGKYVMAAIAMNESSLGANCTPRHEPAWDTGGIYAGNPQQQDLLREFGSAAAMSYGPWQLMFYNCPGYSPDQLLKDPDACARCFLAYFNGYVQRKGAVTLLQIGQVYNGGHVFGEEVPQDVKEYTDRLATNYAHVVTLF